MGNKKGGGIGSKATNAPTTYFTGQPSTKVSPRGVSQIGSSMGNHAMNDAGKILRGQPEPVRAGAMGKMGNTELGNACALDVGKGGPGTGRVTSQSGSHGLVTNPAPTRGRDILSDFGPDSAGVRGRK
jgi:hypothetical protein